MKYAWIFLFRAMWPITLICEVLNVSVSGYFEHQRRRAQDRPSVPGGRHSNEALLAPQFARDRRWRSTELLGNLSNAFATGTCQRNLFTLGEGKVPPSGLWSGWCKIGWRHTATLTEPSSSDSWCHAGNCGCALAGVSMRDRLPERPSLCAMQYRRPAW